MQFHKSPAPLIGLIATLCSLAAGCGSEDKPTGSTADGTNIGGSGVGGAAIGGSSTVVGSTGGTVATGGAATTGGTSTTGTGGVATTGGKSTTGTGGVATTGGAAIGGATGGVTSFGGASSGGTPTGGTKASTGGALGLGGVGPSGTGGQGASTQGGTNATGGVATTGGSVGTAGNAAFVDRWIIDNTTSIHTLTPTLYGSPTVTSTPQGTALCFDGNDGLLLGKNPIEGLAAFTIEVLMRIDGVSDSALAQPRYLHIETTAASRATMEARVTETSYYLDTYLVSGSSNRTLAASSKTHPVGVWVWTALTYENTQMRHFVDAVEDATGSVTVTPFDAGKMSLGVRQNLVNWFVGCIREVRVTSAALPASQLQKVGS